VTTDIINTTPISSAEPAITAAFDAMEQTLINALNAMQITTELYQGRLVPAISNFMMMVPI
jgi:hypothetical protein